MEVRMLSADWAEKLLSYLGGFFKILIKNIGLSTRNFELSAS